MGLGLEKEQGQEERKGEGGRGRRSALKTFKSKYFLVLLPCIEKNYKFSNKVV